MIFWLEIKKYLLEYRRVLFGLASAFFICGLMLLGVNTLAERQGLFEPFTIGIVDRGNSPEIRFVFDFFDEVLALDYLTKEEAEKRLQKGEIPAYAELPERFAEDIMYGYNSPFRLYGNNDYPLQLTLARLLASGAIAYLSSAQAGIYATLDYARDRGLAWDFIEYYILFPINIIFVKHLLDYESFFETEIVPLTGGKSPAVHFVFAFASFLLMLNLLSFTKTLGAYTKAVYARYRLAGISMLRLQGIRLIGPFVINSLLTVPLYLWVIYSQTGFMPAGPENKWITALAGGFSLSFCLSAFGLLAAALFRNETACGLFIFVTALIMLFISGGLVPLAYLPVEIHFYRYAAIPFWAAENYFPLLGMGLLFFGVVYFAEHFRRAA